MVTTSKAKSCAHTGFDLGIYELKFVGLLIKIISKPLRVVAVFGKRAARVS